MASAAQDRSTVTSTEVTLFGFELEIVSRLEVVDPAPFRIRRPALRHPVPWGYGEDDDLPPMPFSGIEEPPLFDVEVYEHQGMGIYRRVS